MASTCELCGADLANSNRGKLPGRRCCVPCAHALFDAAAAAKRRPADFSDPLIGLRDEISALAEKSSAAARGKRFYQLDYGRGLSDAHNYDVALVLCAIAMRDKKGGNP